MRKRLLEATSVLRTLLAALFCVSVLLASNQLSHAQALVALGSISLKGNGITTDSFDSLAANYPGYWTNSIRKAGGDVVTDSSVIGVASIGNANIAGHVRVGPGGTMSIGATGSVGDLAWVDAATSGVEPGWFSDDANVVIPDVAVPSVSWIAAPGSGARFADGVTRTFAHVITASGNYTISDSGDIYIATNCNVTLRVSATVTTFAPTVLYVAGTGTNAAKLKCYVDCATCTLGTGDKTQSGLAANLVFMGTPNCTLLQYSGNGGFAGALYFPEADFLLAGGGSGIVDFIGSAIVKTIQVNGHYHFHFDEAMWDSTWLPSYPFQNRAAVVGQNIHFGVLLSTLGRISYQWRFEGNDVQGATNSDLWLTNIQLTNAGLYEMVATNIYGATTSQVQLAVYDSATPTLQSAAVSASGIFQITIGGVPGFRYAIEVSTNFTDWVPVTTNVAPYIFGDTNAVLSPQGFYRAVYVP